MVVGEIVKRSWKLGLLDLRAVREVCLSAFPTAYPSKTCCPTRLLGRPMYLIIHSALYCRYRMILRLYFIFLASGPPIEELSRITRPVQRRNENHFREMVSPIINHPFQTYHNVPPFRFRCLAFGSACNAMMASLCEQVWARSHRIAQHAPQD